MLVEKLGVDAARGGLVGSACSMALNHLANQAFYAWLPIDHSALVSDAQSMGRGGAIVLSAAASQHITGGLISPGDLVRLNKNFTSVVVSVADSESGEFYLVVKDLLPTDLLGVQCHVELKEVNRVKDLTTRAFKGTTNKDIKAESLYMLGRLFHMLGDLPSAYRQYEDALQLAPAMALAQFAMGKRYLAQKEFSQALEMFEKVRNSSPDDRDTNAYIALIKAIRKQEIVPFEKLKEYAPGFHFEADLWLLQGQLRLRSHNEYPSALKCYESAVIVLEKQGRHVDPMLLSNISVLQISLGDSVGALSNSRRCLELLEMEIQSSLVSGAAHAFLSDVPDHRNPLFQYHENDVFCTWVDIKGTMLDAISLEEYLATHPGPSSIVTGNDCKKFGFSFFSCYPADALQLKASDNVIVGENCFLIVQEVYTTRDRLYFIGKGMKKISPTYNESLDQRNAHLGLSLRLKVPGNNFNEKTVTLCYDYAIILEEMGHTNAAVEIYQQLITVHPTYVECYIRLSKTCLSMGRVKDGLKWLQRAIFVAPKDLDVQTALSDLHLSQGDSVAVMKILMDLCAAKDVRAHVVVANLKRSEMRAGNVDAPLKESYKFYHHVLGCDKKSSYGANGLGIVMAEKKKLEAARDTFTRVRESNTPGSDIVHSACVNLAIVNLAQKKYVDAIQLLHTCMRSLAGTGRPSEYCSIAGQIEIGNLLAMAFVATEYFRDAIRMISKIIFLNPVVLHNWYNLAYAREEFAVNSLRKLPTSVGVADAIADLEAARSMFRQISVLLPIFNAARHISTSCALTSRPMPGTPFSRGFPIARDTLRNVACNLLSFDQKLTTQHEVYCESSIQKARQLLERQLKEEESENSRRTELSALHQQRVQALESQRELEQREKEARRLELQEKARMKLTEFERLRQSWMSMPTPSEKKKSTGKKKSKAGPESDDGVGYSDAEGDAGAEVGVLDNLVDSDDNGNVSDEEVDFGSDVSSAHEDGDEHEGKSSKKNKKDKKHKKDRTEKRKEKREKKRAREEAGNVDDGGGGRLKKRAVMSDEDEDLFEAAAPKPPIDDGLFDSDDEVTPTPAAVTRMEDGAELPRVNRASRVIGEDDDEDEEWNE